MMRKIKFRAWTANTWVAEQWNIKMIYDYQDTTLTEVYGFNSEELPVMQFTGLKDKNGKEIYEKDVVSNVSSYQVETGQVVFYDGAFCLSIISSGTTTSDSKYFLSTCKELEVIGNIYEHSHLLEGK